MANSNDHVLLIPLVVLTLLSTVTADVKTYTLESDTRPLIFLQNFGFSGTGRILLSASSPGHTLHSVSLMTNQYASNSSRVGFFIVQEQALPGLFLKMQVYPNSCPLEHTAHVIPLLILQNLSSSSSESDTYSVPYPGRYHLYFANCLSPYTQVSMHVRADLYNVEGDGSSRNYLSIGQTQLPSLYFTSSVVYISFLAVWSWICFRNRRAVNGAHQSMAVFLVVKIFAKICSAQTHHHVEQSGSPQGWDVLLLLAKCFVVLTFYTMMTMIFKVLSFCKLLKMTEKGKVFTMSLLILVLNDIAFFMIETVYPFPSNSGNMAGVAPIYSILLLIETICCVVICIPIEVAITSIDGAFTEEENMAEDLWKVTWLRKFFLGVVGYFYLATIFVFGLKLAVTYQHEWVCNAIEETVDFVFYVAMFGSFHPVERHDYIVLAEDRRIREEEKEADSEMCMIPPFDKIANIY